jgi:hypothetical protein
MPASHITKKMERRHGPFGPLIFVGRVVRNFERLIPEKGIHDFVKYGLIDLIILNILYGYLLSSGLAENQGNGT